MKTKVAVCCMALGMFCALAGAQVTYTQVTEDADSGLSSSNIYTHAIDFGTSGAATVNGVVFANDIGVGAGAQSNAGTRTYGSSLHPGADPPPAVTGDVASVFLDFVFNGPDEGYIELTGLTVGLSYELRLYERGWDFQGDVRAYSAGFDVGGDGSVEFTTPVINQSDATQPPTSFAGDVSYVTSYVYEADVRGKIRIIIDLVDIEIATYHLYGLTNQNLTAPGGPIIPSSEIAFADELFTLTAPAGAVDGYVWKKNGGAPLGTITDTLVFDPITEADSGTYLVTYDDGSGAKIEVTSTINVFVFPAGAELPLAGPLGLLLLAGACALGGASALRRKK